MGSRWAKALVPATAVFLLATQAVAADACLPANMASGNSPAAAAGRTPTKSVQVFIDGSASMGGYLRATTQSIRPHGDFLSVVGSFSAARGVSPSYFRFGARIAPISSQSGGVSAYATPTPYSCRGCDNQESRIDEVLKVASQGPAGRLTLVVTDMWLSDSAFPSSAQVALGGPLAEILRQGKSVGIIGVRAPYTGPIYDLKSRYAGATERPLFILAIGSEAEVSAFRAALAQSGSPSFSQDRLRYSLFSVGSGNPWRTNAQLGPVGTGVLQTTVLPNLLVPSLRQFRWAPKKGGRIEGIVDAARGAAPGAVWSGKLTGSTKVWLLKDPGGLKRCKPGTWQPYAPLKGAWRSVPGKDTQAQFSLGTGSGQGLVPGKTYLVAGYLGASTLQNPNPANAWMREWSFDEAEERSLVARKPKFFKVLHLGDLASILEEAVDRNKPPSGRIQAATAFVVRVEH
jgi:hypothetical protein